MAVAVSKSAGRVASRKNASPVLRVGASRSMLRVAAASQPRQSVIQPLNGDPFVGMLETPVTSAPIVASYLSNLPAYRAGVAPLLRGVEIGLAHGFLLPGPFIKLGPLRALEGTAEIAGCASAGGLVLILAACLSIYGGAMFQKSNNMVGIKTKDGKSMERDALYTDKGWSEFSAGFTIGGLSGVAFAYICTQVLPYYS